MKRLLKTGSVDRPAHATLHKSRKREVSSSIRGKISSPIPIPNIADEEFPIRTPRADVPMSLGAAVEHGRIPNGQTNNDQDQFRPYEHLYEDAKFDNTRSWTSDLEELRVERYPGSKSKHKTSESEGVIPQNGFAGVIQQPTRRATEPRKRLRDSIFTEDMSEMESSVDIPRRSKSTLRNTLGRLFSRRDKSADSRDAGHSAEPKQTNTHQSDPGFDGYILQGNDFKPSGPAQITEYDRALRSHSVGPDDVLAIESARNSLNAEWGMARRIVDVPDDTLTTQPPSRQMTSDGKLNGLSPRPASSRRRESAQQYDGTDPLEIGRAITSDPFISKRRSRSTSGLPPNSDSRSLERSRSDEFLHLRESYAANFRFPEDTKFWDKDVFDRNEPVDESLLQAKDTAKPPVKHFAIPVTPTMGQPTSFQDGNARSSSNHEGPVTSGLNEAGDDVSLLSDDGPATTEATSVSPRSHHSPSASNGSGAPLSGSPRNRDRKKALSGQDLGQTSRPASMATIKGMHDPLLMSKESPNWPHGDHYKTLLSMIEAEQQARLQLEEEVKRLKRQIHFMAVAPTEKQASSGNFGREFTQGTEKQGLYRPKRQSMSLEDSGIMPDVMDDTESSDAFVTPVEGDQTYLDNISDDRGHESKSPGRALSLSQLTMGVQPPAEIQPESQAT